MENLKICFNTSRLYSSEGQVITALFDKERSLIVFYDHSRMIDGSMSVEDWEVNERWAVSSESFARFIMRRYDQGHYAPFLYAQDQRLVCRDDSVTPLVFKI